MLLPAVLALALGSCGGCGGSEVVDLSISGGYVYAALEDWDGAPEHHVSEDAGQTWVETDEGAPPDATGSDCAADGTCFRVVGHTIEQSVSDGSWDEVWSIPIEREDYVFSHACSFTNERPHGYTMHFTTDPVAVGTEEGSVGIVGMGDQGVVVIKNGSIDRVGLGEWSTPTPFTGSLGGYTGELVIVLLLSLLVFALLVGTRGLTRSGRMVSRRNLLRDALLGALVWSLITLLPYEFWARGVFDSQEAAVQTSRVAGAAALVLLAISQAVSDRRSAPLDE